MSCDKCARLERRIQELEGLIAKLAGIRPPPPPPPAPPDPPAVEKLLKEGVSEELKKEAVRALEDHTQRLVVLDRRLAALEAKLVELARAHLDVKKATERPTTSIRRAEEPKVEEKKPDSAVIRRTTLPAPVPAAPASAPPPLAPAEAAATPAPAVVKSVDAEKLEVLGIPEEFHGDCVRALTEHPKGLAAVAPFLIAGQLPPAAIFHASYAAEKFSKEALERVITKFLTTYNLEAVDLPHAMEADRLHGFEAAEAALQAGFRKHDIVFAAEVVKMWSSPRLGRDAIAKMQELFAQVNAEVQGEDLRYCAMTFKNLGEEFLERALRERHPTNERDPWARGLSIPLLGWAYKLSAPHAGPAIDEAKRRGTRREKLGMEVLSLLGLKFGRKVNPPAWACSSQD